MKAPNDLDAATLRWVAGELRVMGVATDVDGETFLLAVQRLERRLKRDARRIEHAQGKSPARPASAEEAFGGWHKRSKQ